MQIGCICKFCSALSMKEEAEDILIDFSTGDISWKCPKCGKENRVGIGINERARLPKITTLRR